MCTPGTKTESVAKNKQVNGVSMCKAALLRGDGCCWMC